jgi:hypothetical protein
LKPTFERNLEKASISPGEPASSDRSKAIERDVKDYRKKAQIIRMDSGVDLSDLVSSARVYPLATAEEQESGNRLFDHLRLQDIAALALAL